jgi:hypothetical protein
MRITIVCCLCAIGAVMTTLATAEAPKKEAVKIPLRRDVTKSLRIELPAKDLVKLSTAVKQTLDQQEPEPKTPKRRIEAPTKNAVGFSADVPKLVDVDETKNEAIELPMKKLVGNGSSEHPSELDSVRSTETSIARKTNPKVAPGKVVWHKSFEAACAASHRSGKPVLLFQLMGNLDDQFC